MRKCSMDRFIPNRRTRLVKMDVLRFRISGTPHLLIPLSGIIPLFLVQARDSQGFASGTPFSSSVTREVLKLLPTPDGKA